MRMGTGRAAAPRRAVAALTAILAAAATADASTFSIAPIRIEMDRGHQTGVVTLHNDGDAPVTIQVEAVTWSQAEGEDTYAATRDLLVTPPVFVVRPKSDQIVRVARRTADSSAREKTYRLFFQEVPEIAPAGFNGLNVALRIGVPVFVAAPAAAPSELRWQASWLADGMLKVEATNSGLAHVQITDFEVATADHAVIARVGGSRYLLAGGHASWTVMPSAESDYRGALYIRGFSDRGVIIADVAVAAP